MFLKYIHKSAVPRLLSAAALLLAIGLAVCGCGKGSKSSEVKPEDLKPVDPNASAEAQQDQRVKRALAIRDGIMPPEPELKLQGGEQATPEVLAAYNQLLLRHIVQERDAPETIQGLMRIKTLPRLPTPPPGKHIVYDAANQIIRLEPP